MAPLLSGFLHFRPEIRIAGVIFNRVGSPRHYEMLQEVCSELGISCLGYLPKRENLVQESRYLGLDFSRSGGTDALEELTALMETYIDYTRLLEETMLPAPIPSTPDTFRQGDLKISVACSAESFSFIYQEHLDILRRLGTVTFFNPEHNRPLPKGTDLLYLPGGYPEKCHTRLSRAWRRMQSVRNYAEAGGRVLAECGGMIYLSKGILFDRPEHPGIATGPQTGVFPFYISSRKADRRLTLGYRSFDYNGQHLRGHELHYTQFESKTEELPESVGSADTPEELIGAREEARQIQAILHDLPEPYREVFMWRVYAELSYKQIGELFAKSDNWACVTYHRARNMIKNRLEDSNNEK